MEEILDQPLNKNEKDETRINQGVAFIRLLVCLLLLHHLYAILKPSPYNFNVVQKTIFNGLISLTILIIIYNFGRIITEFTKRFVVSEKYRVLILLMIVIHLIWIGDSVRYYVIDHPSLFSIKIPLIGIGLLVITYREIIYFIRATRLKRLKNQ